jgi:hypothetical protein
MQIEINQKNNEIRHQIKPTDIITARRQLEISRHHVGKDGLRHSSQKSYSGYQPDFF